MKSWCIPKPGAKFVAKMEDVLRVYQRPYDPTRPQVCVDEKLVTVHADVRTPLPPAPGQTACQDAEYERKGTANLFVAVEPLTGWCRVETTARRTTVDFAQFVQQVADEDFPAAEVIVLVVDNLNTHGPHALYERFAPEEAARLVQRFEWHYTPEHGSWLNMAECELSVLHRQCLTRRWPDRATLEAQVAAWVRDRTATPVKIVWRFTTADARIKLRQLYPTYQN